MADIDEIVKRTQEAKKKSKKFGADLHFLLGTIAVFIGIAMMIVGLWTEEKASHLREHGVEVHAEVIGVDRIHRNKRDFPYDDPLSDRYNHYGLVRMDHPAQGTVTKRLPISHQRYLRWRNHTAEDPLPYRIYVDPLDSDIYQAATMVETDGGSWGPFIIAASIAFVGFVWALIAAIFMLRARKRKPDGLEL